MFGVNKQAFEPHRYNCKRPWQVRCGDCGKLLGDRHLKAKGQPRRCRPCQASHEMASYLELRTERTA